MIHFHPSGARGEPRRSISGTGTFDIPESCGSENPSFSDFLDFGILFGLPGAREVSKKLPGGRTIHFHPSGARGEPWRPISGTGTFYTSASCSENLSF